MTRFEEKLPSFIDSLTVMFKHILVRRNNHGEYAVELLDDLDDRDNERYGFLYQYNGKTYHTSEWDKGEKFWGDGEVVTDVDTLALSIAKNKFVGSQWDDGSSEAYKPVDPKDIQRLMPKWVFDSAVKQGLFEVQTITTEVLTIKL